MENSYVIEVYDECSICLEYLLDNIKYLKCDHIFHKHCLDTWIRSSNSYICPLCQKKFIEKRVVRQNYDVKNICHIVLYIIMWIVLILFIIIIFSSII